LSESQPKTASDHGVDEDLQIICTVEIRPGATPRNMLKTWKTQRRVEPVAPHVQEGTEAEADLLPHGQAVRGRRYDAVQVQGAGVHRMRLSRMTSA
jgi:hypothetical protein